MDQITIKTTNPKCRLYWYFIELIDWRYSQKCWFFVGLVSLQIFCPQGYLFIQCVTGGGGDGIRVCGEHLQELYTVYFTRFRTYKIALPLQTKTEQGRGPQTGKHLPPNPFPGLFLRQDNLKCLVSLQLFGPWVRYRKKNFIL